MDPLTGSIAYLTDVLGPLLHQGPHQVVEHCGRREFLFAPSGGADYCFSIDAYHDGEANLGAALVGDRPSREYFWYVALELPDYASSKLLAEDLLAKAMNMMSHRSRITQRRGLLLWDFYGEFEQADGWRSTGGVSAFRWGGLAVPKIEGRERIYYSPALF